MDIGSLLLVAVVGWGAVRVARVMTTRQIRWATLGVSGVGLVIAVRWLALRGVDPAGLAVVLALSILLGGVLALRYLRP